MLSDSVTNDNRRVLVIDDDEGDCCLVEDILAEDGVLVEKAVGGEAGIRKLSREDFPVVITDLRMPDINGFGVLNYINKRHMDTLVVVVTGYASIDTVMEALRNGAYDYIIKPFGPELLRLTVKRAFDFISLRDGRDRIKYFDMVTCLATTTAHEVFQPLTVLMGQAKAISKTTDDPEIGELSEAVLVEARKIRDVIRKMENLKEYAEKTFPGGHVIIDIEKGSSDDMPD